MNRAACSLLLACVLVGCGSSGPAPTFMATPTAAPQTAAAVAPASAVARASAGAQPSAAAVQPSPEPCQGVQTPGNGTHTVGTVSGKLATGRILFDIEGVGGTTSGTFALAYIDSGGLHQISYPLDWSDGGASWASSSDILFDSQRAGEHHIFRLNAVDGTVTQLTKQAGTAEVGGTLLPDGRLLFSAYQCSETPVDPGVYESAADGTGVIELTPGPRPGGFDAFDSSPQVSLDGKTVVFVRALDDNTGALFTVPAAGGALKRLTPDAAHVADPHWSPDGKTILFTQDSGATFDMWTVNADSGVPVQLSHSQPGTGRLEGDWSPDGKQVVFKYFEQGWNFNELHVASADGTNETVLWRGDNSTAEMPDWGE